MEKAPKARIGDLDKKKYLVPSDLTGNYREDQQSDGHPQVSLAFCHPTTVVILCFSDSGPVLLPHPEKNPLES